MPAKREGPSKECEFNYQIWSQSQNVFLFLPFAEQKM